MSWNKSAINIDELNSHATGTLAQLLDIQFTEIGEYMLKATMPVCAKTHQPHGLLHGGASAALAETVGSIASWLTIDREKQTCVGTGINCNHVRSKKTGVVTAVATPLHLGASSHIWDIRIQDEDQKLICQSRLSVAVLKKPD